MVGWMIQRSGSTSWKTVAEITEAEQKKEKRIKRNEDSLRDLWDNIKHRNIGVLGVPAGEEREKGADIFEDIIAEHSPNLGKEMDIQVQEHRESQTERGPHQDT